MKNEIASNYIMKAKIHLRFFISGIYKFTVTVDLQKMREINNRFAPKFVSTNIFTKSKDGWDRKRPLKAPNSLVKQGQIAGCPGEYPEAFKCFQGLKPWNLSWATCGSVWSSSQWKKCFLKVKENLLCFSLCPLTYFHIRGIALLSKEYDAYQIDHAKKKQKELNCIRWPVFFRKIIREKGHWPLLPTW